MSIFIFILGAIVGSFLNVVIFRLHAQSSILGRSLCLFCKKFIQWYDNIPIFSFFRLRGKCRWCQQKISWQYPLVELTTGILFLLAYWQSPTLILLFRNLIFIAVLIVIFVYDWRWYLILDVITVPATVFAFFVNLFLGYGLGNLLLGAVIGGGFFLMQFLVSSGRWIGGGDIRLGILLGVMLGWKLLLVTLFLAYLSGSIVGLGLIIAKQKKFSSPMPFGTFLAAAAIVSLLYGEPLWQWYLALI